MNASWSMEPFSQDTVLVTVALVLVAILAVLTVIGMIVGARNRSRRRSAEHDEQSRLDQLRADGVETTNDAAARPASETAVPEASVSETAVPEASAQASPPATAAAIGEPVTAAADVPAGAGDAATPVTMLKGLGPKIATRLAEVGVTTVGQLAWLDDQEAADLDAQLGPFQGRMSRDRWREQARLLAQGDRAGFEREFGKLG